MRFKDLLLDATRAIYNNKQRSFLTMLGIIIGVGCVITILTLGKSFENYTMENLNRSGNSQNIKVSIYFSPDNIDSFENSNADFFSESDFQLISKIEGVTNVEILKDSSSVAFDDVTIGGKKYQKAINFGELDENQILSGRNLTEKDHLEKARNVLISEEFSKEVFSSTDVALNKTIEYNGYIFSIVGIIEETNTPLLEMKKDIIMPQNTADFYFRNQERQQNIELSIKQGHLPSTVTKQVLMILSKNGSNAYLGEYSSFDLSELTDGIGKVLQSVTLFIAFIAGISLVIAGIGIMNMMYISVAERTEEIAIRRALGAKKKEIRVQFLLEGCLLSISGGILGYLIGILLALSISILLPFRLKMDVSMVLLSIGISVIIGLLSSFVPANKAAQKNIIEILR